MRYPHFISRAKQGKWPELVIGVDCKTVAESVDGTEKRQIEKLVSWHADTLMHDINGYSRVNTLAGMDTQSFWEIIADNAANCYSMWIISYQCGRIWSLLGLWDMLETGYVSILPRSVARQERIDVSLRKMRKRANNPLGPLSAGALSRLLSRDTGALITDDPPALALFTVGGGKYMVSWLDVRNYGVEYDDDTKRGAGTAAEIVRFWVDYARSIRDYRLGSPRTTAGAQAFHGWRTSYYQGGVHVHTQREALALEGLSYHGGRCECFQLGVVQRPVVHLDVRSLYPSICASQALPARLVGVSAIASRQGTWRTDGCQGRIAEVTIESGEPAYPRVRDGITVWPVGRFRTTLAGPELEDAERLGRVVAYHRVAFYDMVPCLKEYAEVLYALRVQSEQQGRSSLCQAAKKLLVSLPGKFAQHERHWEPVPFTGAHPLWGEWWGSDSTGQPARFRSLGGPVQQDRDLGFGGEAVPSIASWITSAGRMVLLAAIRQAGWDQCYYCDTDSLIVSELGYQRLLESGCVANRELGMWQVKEFINDATIYGIKHYFGAGTLTCAGLPKGSTCRSADPARYWYTDSATRQIQARHKPEATRRLLPYQRTEEYRHGIVGEDGRVTPFRLEEV